MDFVGQENNDVLFWLNDRDLQEVFTSKYWNDEEVEKKKEWYILDGNTHKLVSYLKEKTTYFREYESIIKFAEDMGLKIEGMGVDLAAGICWTTALLSHIVKIKKLYALDISKHRILKIAPKVFNLFNADMQKITRVVGDFYDIRLPDGSINFCFMTNAFHHAENPNKLLSEIYRILKPSGIILVMGERPIYPKDFFKKYVKNIIKILTSRFIRDKYKTKPIYKIFPDFRDLYPTDMRAGDNYYRLKDYRRIFESNGFKLHENNQRRFRTFIAVKE